jgi:transposase
MGLPSSLDWRQKILQAHERGMGSQREIAECFGVSLSFVEKLLQQVRTTGNAAAKKQGRGPSTRLNTATQEQVRHWVEQPPDITLAELADRLDRITGVRVRRSTLCRLLPRLGIPLKKRLFMPGSGTPQEYATQDVNTAGK